MGVARQAPSAPLASRPELSPERRGTTPTARRWRDRHHFVLQSRRGVFRDRPRPATGDGTELRAGRRHHWQHPFPGHPLQRHRQGSGDGDRGFPAVAGGAASQAGPNGVGRSHCAGHGPAGAGRSRQVCRASPRHRHAIARGIGPVPAGTPSQLDDAHRAGVAPALRRMTLASTSAVRWRRRDMLTLAPPLTLALGFLPIAGGVIGTVLPAFGWLPALDARSFNLAPWRDLLAAPELAGSVRLTLSTGTLATVATFLVAIFF